MKYIILFTLIFALSLAETSRVNYNLTQEGGWAWQEYATVICLPILFILIIACISYVVYAFIWECIHLKHSMMMVPTSNYQMPQYAPIPQQEMMIADPKLQIVYMQPSM